MIANHQSIGGAIASFMLGLVGFVANQDQLPIVINMIVFLRFGMPLLGYVASLISMWFYEITSENMLKSAKSLMNAIKNKTSIHCGKRTACSL